MNIRNAGLAVWPWALMSLLLVWAIVGFVVS
jgi:hypothetical protein